MPQTMQKFIKIIAHLRHPKQGCPWDLAQNFQTMIPHLLEESYEVVEAIEKQDEENLKEELGDLLLQVVFLSQLACEENRFNFNDVLYGITNKIIRRHPHVFGDMHAKNAEDALRHWQHIKALERQEKPATTSLLDNIPLAFPALMRAEKIQKRCAKVGFDWHHLDGVIAKVEEEWHHLDGVIAKVEEEWQEVKTELTHGDTAKLEEELGDFLFTIVNLSRHLHLHPEESLRKANQKFERRFKKLEQKLNAKEKDFNQVSLAEMDALWDEVKQEEKNTSN